MFTRKTILFIAALCLLTAPLALAYAAAAGSITGVVTDPKGAVIVGAAVTVTDPVSNQTYPATTDKAGRYKVEGLPAGIYTVTISATGFTNLRRENVKVEDDKVATIDAKLEIAAVETQVNVSLNNKPNTDSIYQQLRNKAKDANSFSGPYAKVSNLVIKRDAATFTLKSGDIYFLDPVENRITGGVFIGDGEVTVTPPNEIEKKSLTIFTNEPTMTEQ
ncbi:MAG: carboxypeptidase regulatory-like domain-containing protein, partial [Acidobacteria bacterium]|nr:carboxypeptidase regulatory-like domain-containing protein [Acidobacteriota bacterium]